MLGPARKSPPSSGLNTAGPGHCSPLFVKFAGPWFEGEDRETLCHRLKDCKSWGKLSLSTTWQVYETTQSHSLSDLASGSLNPSLPPMRTPLWKMFALLSERLSLCFVPAIVASFCPALDHQCVHASLSYLVVPVLRLGGLRSRLMNIMVIPLAITKVQSVHVKNPHVKMLSYVMLQNLKVLRCGANE